MLMDKHSSGIMRKVIGDSTTVSICASKSSGSMYGIFIVSLGAISVCVRSKKGLIY